MQTLCILQHLPFTLCQRTSTQELIDPMEIHFSSYQLYKKINLVNNSTSSIKYTTNFIKPPFQIPFLNAYIFLNSKPQANNTLYYKDFIHPDPSINALIFLSPFTR